MSVFSQLELDYLAGQRLGRIATIGPDGAPHGVPVSFRRNAVTDTIDIGGIDFALQEGTRPRARSAGRLRCR